MLEANKDYWGGAPKLKNLIIKPAPEIAARIAELQTGNADVIVNIPLYLVSEVKKDPNAIVQSLLIARAQMIQINCFQDGPLKDKKVRQALNYAVDRKALCNGIVAGAVPNALGFLPGDFGYDASVKPFPYDPAKAKKLLAQAGYPNGFRIELNTPNGAYPMDKEVMEAVAKMFEAVGVKTDVKVMEFGAHLQTIATRKLKDLAIIGMSGTLKDLDSQLSSLYNQESKTSYFWTPSLTAKINQARTTMDSKKRIAIYKQIQTELYDEAPFVYLYQLTDHWGVSKEVKGFQVRDDEMTIIDNNVSK